MSETDVKVGDRITIPFGKGEKEGVVEQVAPNNVYLRVDFPRHPGKRIRRKLSDLGPRAKGKKEKK